MSLDEYLLKSHGDFVRRAIEMGISSEAVEVLQLIAQQNILLIKSYHEGVVLPLLTERECKAPEP